MRETDEEDGMMTLVPVGTTLIQQAQTVKLIFPTEDDAIIFVELLNQMSGGLLR